MANNLHHHFTIQKLSQAILLNPYDIDAIVSRAVANDAVGNKSASVSDLYSAAALPPMVHRHHLKVWASANIPYIETINCYLTAKVIAANSVMAIRHFTAMKVEFFQNMPEFGNGNHINLNKADNAKTSFAFIDCFMGEVLAMQGHHSRAILAFDDAIEANSTMGWYFYLRSVSKAATGDVSGSELDLQNAAMLGYIK